MARNTSITLSDYFEKFVDGEISSGRFGNTSEVVRAGLRLLEREENALQALRAAIDDGLSSGEPVNGTEAFAHIRAKHGLKSSGE
jgi:antitoxin ParD1/3/4